MGEKYEDGLKALGSTELILLLSRKTWIRLGALEKELLGRCVKELPLKYIWMRFGKLVPRAPASTYWFEVLKALWYSPVKFVIASAVSKQRFKLRVVSVDFIASNASCSMRSSWVSVYVRERVSIFVLLKAELFSNFNGTSSISTVVRVVKGWPEKAFVPISVIWHDVSTR